MRPGGDDTLSESALYCEPGKALVFLRKGERFVWLHLVCAADTTLSLPERQMWSWEWGLPIEWMMWWLLVVSRGRVEKRVWRAGCCQWNVRGQQAGPHQKTGFMERSPGHERAGEWPWDSFPPGNNPRSLQWSELTEFEKLRIGQNSCEDQEGDIPELEVKHLKTFTKRLQV